MSIAHSRLTAQGQISVPASIRKKLGLGPGSTIEWDEEDDRIVVRRVGQFSSEELHAAIFPTPPRARSLEELNAGRAKYVKRRHARR